MRKPLTAALRTILALVRRGTVFSHYAFRYVDVIFGAVAAASVLLVALAVMLAPGDAEANQLRAELSKVV
jgi:hypothetical protein